jgi:predicted dehydrogenase
MYWLLDSEPTEVSAYSLPTGRNEPIGENNLAASFRFADGSVANLTYCTVGSRLSAGERLEAFADGIGVRVEDFGSRTISDRLRARQLRPYPLKGHAEQMRDFFDALRMGRAPQVTVVDGARATLACLKMLESARTLRPCPIEIDSLRP